MNLRKVYILVFSLITVCLFGQTSFKESSVLKSGKWYKIKVEKSGIYKLSYDELKAIGIETPENIRIYGQSGKQLSYYNDSTLEDDLTEMPIYSSNANFGSGDYYLFYASGVENVSYFDDDLMFVQNINDYALYNYYYLTSSFGPGKRIEESSTSSLSPNLIQSSYDWIGYYEEEKYSLINTGRQWVGEKIEAGSVAKRFTINNIIESNPVKLKTAVVVRSGSDQFIGINANGKKLTSISITHVDVNSHTSQFARNETYKTSFYSNSPNVDISFDFTASNYSDQAYIDYVTINARANLVLQDDAFYFRDYSSVGIDNVTKFQLSNYTSSYQIWNITDYDKVYSLPLSVSGTNISFNVKTDKLQEFVAVNTSANFSSPIFVDEKLNDVGELKDFQNLHGMDVPELLIVTHPAFLSQAEELGQLHRDFDNMKVHVVTTEQVYNEFSSGRPEIAAIRNFARMFYERSNTIYPFKYLLLFGDGSFDNRTLNVINPNYIPTYQSENSLSPTSSYVSDDFYALLDPEEGGVSGLLDIGVGRLPVSSDGNDELEAQGVVDKIIAYCKADVMSDWRNNMIFLGDDGESGWDQEIFMKDSDYLTSMVEKEVPTMNFNKVYLDAFQQISSSTGASYPEAEETLQEAFNKGALVFNYMGHGGESGITQEQVLKKSDFENMTNDYLPLFITATCQLSRYDNVDINGQQYARKVSAGEAALLNPDGGAIALLTTTRLVYHSSNKIINQNVFNTLFKKDHNQKRLKLGDVMRIAKNNTSSQYKANTAKFSLLGDPAITLAFGENKVIIDSINNISVLDPIDTLNALGEVSLTGYIAYDDSTIINDFNGFVYASIFDKKYLISTNGNDDIPIFDFTMQDKLLFRGKASVNSGRFTVVFKVPKDISYSLGQGKISLYAENGIIDAKGAYTNFIIGGTKENPEFDIDGPEISLYMNNENFVDGGITDPSPILVANVFDQNGINTTGNGIGHNLIGILDEDLSESYLLNDYFEGALDDYRRGQLRYKLSELENGYHTIMVKVWDTYNNSTDESISFYVDNSSNLVINELLNYPNPASNGTSFQYAHNMPGMEHKVNIDIFDATGRIIYQISRTFEEEGYVSEPIYWNIRKNYQVVAPGVYPYRITVLTSEGHEGIKSGSLIIIP